jgi:hypothetical protein
LSEAIRPTDRERKEKKVPKEKTRNEERSEMNLKKSGMSPCHAVRLIVDQPELPAMLTDG